MNPWLIVAAIATAFVGHAALIIRVDRKGRRAAREAYFDGLDEGLRQGRRAGYHDAMSKARDIIRSYKGVQQ